MIRIVTLTNAMRAALMLTVLTPVPLLAEPAATAQQLLAQAQTRAREDALKNQVNKINERGMTPKDDASTNIRQPSMPSIDVAATADAKIETPPGTDSVATTPTFSRDVARVESTDLLQPDPAAASSRPPVPMPDDRVASTPATPDPQAAPAVAPVPNLPGKTPRLGTQYVEATHPGREVQSKRLRNAEVVNRKIEVANGPVAKRTNSTPITRQSRVRDLPAGNFETRGLAPLVRRFVDGPQIQALLDRYGSQ